MRRIIVAGNGWSGRHPAGSSNQGGGALLFISALVLLAAWGVGHLAGLRLPGPSAAHDLLLLVGLLLLLLGTARSLDTRRRNGPTADNER